MKKSLEFKELKSYKYILTQAVSYQTNITGFDQAIETPLQVYVTLDREGLLTLAPGYAWDGVTAWPDSDNTLYPSLIHDALFQLIAAEDSQLNSSIHKKLANDVFFKLLKANGVPKWKRNIFKIGVSLNEPSTRFREGLRTISYRH